MKNKKDNKNVIGLAKDKPKSNRGRKNEPVKKNDEPYIEFETSNVGEVNDEIKNKIDNLIGSITPPTEVVKDKKVPEKKGNEWLEEQLDLVLKEVEKLRVDLDGKNKELTETKNGYTKLHNELINLKNNKNIVYDDSKTKGEVVKFYHDVQNAYLKMGGKLVIVPGSFLNRMIKFFPFLAKEKKF